MSDFKRTIESLAGDFARNVLAALRDASLSDLAGVGSSSGAAPARRSARVAVAAPRRADRAGRKARPGWPKCQVCGKNAHPRGKGYCWEHALAAGVAKGSGGPGKIKKKRAKRAAAAK